MTQTKPRRAYRKRTKVPRPEPFVLRVRAVYTPDGTRPECDLILEAPGCPGGEGVDVLTVHRKDWPGETWPPTVGILVRVIPARVEPVEVET